MKPRSLEEEGRQGKMFQARLDQILNLKHPLVELGQSIDWAMFEQEFGGLYVEQRGCPGLPIRLLVGGEHGSQRPVCHRRLEGPESGD